MLSAVPFGASSSDTAEFMLGDVAVSVVLLESNGAIDADTESWQPEQVADVKRTIAEGLTWWEDLLAAQNSVHSLNFVTDFTYVDQPIQTGYEPISRRSDDFTLWIEDFFTEVGVGGSASFSERIRVFNHHQRLRHNTNWAFTVFVVNADQDADRRFDPSGSFSLSFAYPGGEFFVTTSERPASSIAHETAHMFWGMDEYPGSKTYINRRGYYDTQNLNAYDGHPDPGSRVRSILDSTAMGYALDALSPSGMETIGWRDSDGDGIFDVLDVPHVVEGTGVWEPTREEFHFTGSATVQALANRNRSGNGNDITINRIDEVQVRFDAGPWQTVVEPRAYDAQLDFVVDVPIGADRIEVRAVDLRTTVDSNVWEQAFENPTGWRNPENSLDVNEDQFVTPLDALLVINNLNARGPRALSDADVGLPYLDTNGDGFLSPIDALRVINGLNESTSVEVAPPAVGGSAEGEWDARSARTFAACQSSVEQTAFVGSGRTHVEVTTLVADARRKTAVAAATRELLDEYEPFDAEQRKAANRAVAVDSVILELSEFELTPNLKLGAIG